MRTFLALVLAVSISAQAQSPAPGTTAGNPHLAAAQRLYQRLDLDAALAELNLAEAATKDDDETVQVLIYRGLIYAETGKNGESQDAFKRALAIRPWAEVPQGTSPRLAKAFGETRKALWGSSGIKPPPRKRTTTEAPKAAEQAPAKPAK